jgi:branched-chain amino acid aminotransferase
MAVLPIHKFFISEGEIIPVSNFIEAENEGGIYEVIRVIQGVPLFLEDHLQRFYVSARLAQKEIRFSIGQISEFIEQLIEANNCSLGNMLISCKTKLKLFFIAHYYPTNEFYEKGIKCGILRAERENPNAKIFQTNVRGIANALMQKNNFYEVLLEDKQQRITEGSRSNVFFIKNKQVFTPPGNEVLLGITRQKTIQLINKLGLILVEEDVFSYQLNEFNSVFITGTSPKILPVKTIDNQVFSVDNLWLKRLMSSYDELISSYIKQKSR